MLVSASSERQGDDALISTALAALGCEDVRVVVSTAAHDPARFSVPANARVQRWVAHGDVLQKASLAAAGGAGAAANALEELLRTGADRHSLGMTIHMAM